MSASPQDKSRFEDENRTFFQQWLRRPKEMGSITPSSRYFARAIARNVSLTDDQVLLELGAGTGSVTRHLINAGIPAKQIVSVELDPAFQPMLNKIHPDLRVFEGDCTKIDEILAANQIENVGTIVCGIPMVTAPIEFQRTLFGKCFELLPEDGFILQLSYSPFSPIPHKKLGLCASVCEFVLRNIPPAHLWKFERGESS